MIQLIFNQIFYFSRYTFVLVNIFFFPGAIQAIKAFCTLQPKFSKHSGPLDPPIALSRRYLKYLFLTLSNHRW
jgi:hypothetical protein